MKESIRISMRMLEWAPWRAAQVGAAEWRAITNPEPDYAFFPGRDYPNPEPSEGARLMYALQVRGSGIPALGGGARVRSRLTSAGG